MQSMPSQSLQPVGFARADQLAARQRRRSWDDALPTPPRHVRRRLAHRFRSDRSLTTVGRSDQRIEALSDPMLHRAEQLPADGFSPMMNTHFCQLTGPKLNGCVRR